MGCVRDLLRLWTAVFCVHSRWRVGSCNGSTTVIPCLGRLVTSLQLRKLRYQRECLLSTAILASIARPSTTCFPQMVVRAVAVCSILMAT